jgi:hypothetical protein
VLTAILMSDNISESLLSDEIFENWTDINKLKTSNSFRVSFLSRLNFLLRVW